MKNKVLIIYPFVNQEPLVSHLVENLRNNGVNADAINSFNFEFAVKPLHDDFLQAKIISFLFKLPIPKIKGFLSKIINKEKRLLKIATNYEVIDFHYSTKEYDNMIKKLADTKVIKITFWGSDFYRANIERKEQQRQLMHLAYQIGVTTETMKSDFVEYFKDFHDKLRVANFGLYQFEVISEILKKPYPPKFKTEEYKDKLMIVCGYNGSEGQQHLILIEAIDKIDQNIKNRMFLVFPMTYGGEVSYLKMIEAKLNNLNIPFLFLTNHLSNVDIAKLRLETDIAINIQTTDAFSGSLQEHLFAENLLLVGDWLPYQILDDNQVFFKRIQISSLGKNISDSIINFDILKSQTLGNREKMDNISSWRMAGKKISNIYKELKQ